MDGRRRHPYSKARILPLLIVAERVMATAQPFRCATADWPLYPPEECNSRAVFVRVLQIESNSSLTSNFIRDAHGSICASVVVASQTVFNKCFSCVHLAKAKNTPTRSYGQSCMYYRLCATQLYAVHVSTPQAYATVYPTTQDLFWTSHRMNVLTLFR